MPDASVVALTYSCQHTLLIIMKIAAQPKTPRLIPTILMALGMGLFLVHKMGLKVGPEITKFAATQLPKGSQGVSMPRACLANPAGRESLTSHSFDCAENKACL